MSDGTPRSQLLKRYIAPETLDVGTVCRVIRIPNTLQFFGAIDELLSRLTFPDVWEDNPTGVSAQEAAWRATEMFDAYLKEDCMSQIGLVQAFANEITPANMLLCDGTIYLNTEYPELASVIDPAYRVDETQFTVPDLRGRVAVGEDTGNVIDNLIPLIIGMVGGHPLVGLLLQQLARHKHTTGNHTHGARTSAISDLAQTFFSYVASGTGDFEVNVTDGGDGTGRLVNDADPSRDVDVDAAGEGDTTEEGDGEPHENMQPFSVLRYGIFWK